MDTPSSGRGTARCPARGADGGSTRPGSSTEAASGPSCPASWPQPARAGWTSGSSDLLTVRRGLGDSETLVDLLDAARTTRPPPRFAAADGRRALRNSLRSIERAEPEEQWAVSALAGRSVEIDPEELNAALRRAELLLATGGDPRRSPELYGRAVTAIARDLDTSSRRAQLLAALEMLEPEARDLPGAGEALRLLLADPDLAWQSYARAARGGVGRGVVGSDPWGSPGA